MNSTIFLVKFAEKEKGNGIKWSLVCETAQFLRLCMNVWSANEL